MTNNRRFRMPREEIVENLRLAFQERVSEEEFTLTETETEALLTMAPIGSLLQSFTDLGRWLQQEKVQRLMWYDEKEICEVLLPQFIRKLGKRQ